MGRRNGRVGSKILLGFCLLGAIGGVLLSTEGLAPWWSIPLLALAPLITVLGMWVVTLVGTPVYATILFLVYFLPSAVIGWVRDRIRK